MRPWPRPWAPPASSAMRAPPGSSTLCCAASSASAARSSRRWMRTLRCARRIRCGSRPRSRVTGPARMRRSSRRATRIRRSGCASTGCGWGSTKRRARSKPPDSVAIASHSRPMRSRSSRPRTYGRCRASPRGACRCRTRAAQLAFELLAARAGDRILDACAAPGGKTCHLLERTGGAAQVTAVDASPARLERVRANLDRLGLVATLVAGDALRPDAWWDGRPFDRILLDVPCSATGVIRRHPDIKLLRRPGDVPPLARRQRAMLDALWPLLRPGGRFLYTSCSVLTAENGEVVKGFLETTPAASDATSAAVAGWPEPPDYDRSRVPAAPR